jgi:C1A family cysteine protease
MPRAVKKLTQKIIRYGWRRDNPDRRDIKWAAPKPVLRDLPTKADNRHLMPEIWQQGNTNSCTGQSMAAQIYGFQKKSGVPTIVTPSALFIYYNTRDIEDTENVDSGATLRNTLKAVSRWGYTGNNCWPFDVTKINTKPVKPCYEEADPRKISQYQRVDQREDQIKAYLAIEGTISFGFAVYPNFESDSVRKSGILTMPSPNDAPYGGHAVLLVGYDDSTRMYLVRNSWGADWGLSGYFWMPYDYVHHRDLAADFWSVTSLPMIA